MKEGRTEAQAEEQSRIEEARRKGAARIEAEEAEESLTKLSAEEKFEKVARRIRKNAVIAKYYREYGKEVLEAEGAHEPFELSDKGLKLWTACRTSAENMPKCCGIWEIDEYKSQKVKDVIKTNLCRNRFCDNCQNVLSIKRDRKYAPYLDELSKDYDVYFITFTQTNCYAEELLGCVNKMFYNFGYIVRLFAGNAKIKGYDFLKYGFIGGIRAIEITKNEDEGTFHPHFHCLFALRKGQRLADEAKRKHINRYSFNNEDVKKSHKKKEAGEEEKPRKFSDFEILLQKVWRLRYDGVRVTAKNIEELPIGYSVVCERCNPNAGNRYKDVFKYATKGIFKTGDDDKISIGNEDFKALFPALLGRRVIQGYGVLNAIDFEASEAEAEKQEREYMEILAKLRAVEAPRRTYEYLHQIEEELKRKQVKYISRSSLHELTGEDYEG